MRIKRLLLLSLLWVWLMPTKGQQWKPAGDRIRTIWADQVNPACPLPEYPRPLMVRDSWQNLNGSWDYALLPKGSGLPLAYDGKILVPFAIESSLSGVQKKVGMDQELWYKRMFHLPEAWKGKRILLNFGAVDWKCDVWINDIKVGGHKGGYTAFSLDITPFLGKGEQQLTVRVWDPSDKGFQPRGKQVEDPRGIWYTSVTGIWQTVWMEAVGENYLTQVVTVPDIDAKSLTIKTLTAESHPGDLVEISVLEQGKVVASGKSAAGEETLMSIPGMKLWNPESPFLYDLNISLMRNGKVVDKVKSYVGMRKISLHRDKEGVVRLQLNNQDYFQFGPLDQGWWPDGLYTAPTDEALAFDIRKTKDFGFNMIRKHVKVEPARWYYHCDKEGMLVWQDMPSGGESPQWQQRAYFNGKEMERSAESEENYKAELKAIIDQHLSYPCIVTWVPFNEAWGQFKTPEIAAWIKQYDPSRLVNPASGGNFYPVGDMLDIHNYPAPDMPLYDGKRACVLGEYGGLGLPVEGHLWVKDKNWGYVQYKSSEEVTKAYLDLTERLKSLITKGFSAAVYTQTTDVEVEINGLMTYDRKVIKLDENQIRKANL
ncbi:MAG: beta-galactosidase, partial [Marinilabiliales bacterium]|nr:beta-galactosidase [Marinilabiliales bacterium]